MFLNFIKNFAAKRILNKDLHEVASSDFSLPIQKLGLLVDVSVFSKTQQLIDNCKGQGILEKDIQVLLFKEAVKKTDTFDFPIFSYKDVSWFGSFNNEAVNQFIAADFDLLISYNKVPKVPLSLITHQSKAKCKAGVSSENKRLNQIVIETSLEENELYVNELFKYLSKLNKT